MTLEEKVKDELKKAMKDKNPSRKNTLRLIISEFDRKQDRNVSTSDDEVIAIITKMRKSLYETATAKGGMTEDDWAEDVVYGEFLPQLASKDAIRAWIIDNTEAASVQGNARMRFMKDIMSHFGKEADGNTVKEVLLSI